MKDIVVPSYEELIDLKQDLEPKVQKNESQKVDTELSAAERKRIFEYICPRKSQKKNTNFAKFLVKSFDRWCFCEDETNSSLQ